jgi:hypothetical protein
MEETMKICKSLTLISLFLIFACSHSTQSNKEEIQANVEKAELKSKLELVIELAAVIEGSKLSDKEKDTLIRKYEDFIKKIVSGQAEQNKIVSAFINNLSTKDPASMSNMRAYLKRFEEVDRENSKLRNAMLKEIGEKIQGRIDQEKIEKINQLLNQRGYLIIQTMEEEKNPKSKKQK